MKEALTAWIARRKEIKLRHQLVADEFKKKYPDRKFVQWQLKETELDHGQILHTLCYGQTKPPIRSWWIFRSKESIPEELSGEEVKKLIEIPKWL